MVFFVSYSPTSSTLVDVAPIASYSLDDLGCARFATEAYDFTTQNPAVTNIVCASAIFRQFDVNLFNSDTQAIRLLGYGINTQILPNSEGNNVLVKVNGWFQCVSDENYSSVLNYLGLRNESHIDIEIMAICE